MKKIKLTTAKQLKLFRTELGLTRVQMAAALDTLFKTYRYWEMQSENDRQPPGAVLKLARAMVASTVNDDGATLRRVLWP